MSLADRTHRYPGGKAARRPARDRGGRVPPSVLRTLGTPRTPRRSRAWLYFLGGLLALALLLPSVALAVGGVFYTNTANSLRPRLDKVASYHEQAFQTSRIFDRNGELLYEFVNAGRRDPVKLSQINPLLIDATISVEDKTFYENVGVDYFGIARAVYQNISNRAEVSGASTITQQLIKLVILSDEETAYENRYRRKLSEIILAQQINQDYTKDEILELYLNEINYGNLAYGIQAAAKSYFGINASDLNLSQASLLAGLPQQPTLYNPIQYIDNEGILRGVRLKRGWLNPLSKLPNGITLPRARQVDVLRQMVLNGKVSQREAERAIAQDLTFAPQEVAIHAPHFVFYVKQVLEQDPIIGPLLANEGGLAITTTLDLRMQQIAQTEAARRIEELERENRNIHNAAVVVMQPRTGQLLSMVGSIDYNRSKATTTPGEEGNVLDGNVNVTTRDRQPGSALKPFTYLSAIVQNKLNPGSILWDVETRFPIKEEATKKNLDDKEFWYGPKNFDQKWHGPLRMRESLANSLNMPAVKALKRAGIKETLDLLHSVGINGLRNPPEYYGLALTLGGGEVTPLDLTAAYNTLASDGEYVPPTPIIQITDRSGHTIPFSPGERRQAVDPKYVAIVRDFMGDNDARTPMFGPNNPLKLSRPAHAKTGTTEDFRDAWAVGYTPYVTIGVWTGNNNNEKTDRVESVTSGGVIWNRIMETYFKDGTIERLLRGPNLSVPVQFPDPKTYGLEERKVCQIGGRFGKRDKEWFVPTQPADQGEARPAQEDCDLYKTIKVARDTSGNLCWPATGSSARLIETKVWSLPPSTEEEMLISPAWEGGSLRDKPLGRAPEHICGQPNSILRQIPWETDQALQYIVDESGPAGDPAPAANDSAPVTSSDPQPVPPQPATESQPAVQLPVQPAPAVAQPPVEQPPVQLPVEQPPVQPPVEPPPVQPPVEQPPVEPPPVQPPVEQPPVQPPVEQPPVQPPPAPEPEPQLPTLPSLVGLGENQAREVLASLGVTNVVVDYQGPDRLGDLYNQVPAYAVVSSSPGPGTPITPGMTVVLGVRAP